MKRYGIALVVLLASTSASFAWNNKGHMTVARVAWNGLTPAEQTKVIAILKAHPHFDEFLNADRPANFAQDEWIFLRGATWADWVRSGPPARRKFSVPDRHFIDIPIIAQGSNVKPPPLKEENIVNGIKTNLEAAKTETDRAKQAVAVTWLLHLLGDISQPLHASTRYSDNFPNGDRGGNSALVRVSGGGVIQMHHFWDGLLGTAVSRSSILKTVADAEALAKDDPTVAADLAAHTTPEQWAQETNALAVKIAYLDGKVEPANSADRPETSEIPTVPADYAETAGETAQLCAIKGGRRLAALLKAVVKDN